jgi:uncharacterized protein
LTIEINHLPHILFIMVEKVYVTYNEVHNQCKEGSKKILKDFQPNLMIAIGGGGYVPARILRYCRIFTQCLSSDKTTRSFLRKEGAPNIPIQAIGLSLYETLSTDAANVVEAPGTKVTRTQWLDLSSLQIDSLIGKNILIVDEVDDTRTTLEYAVRELEKDIETARQQSGRTEKTNFFVFVLHNKKKPKKGRLPDEMESGKTYLAAEETGDVWICYPWEATEIEKHDEMAKAHGLKKFNEGKPNGTISTDINNVAQ